MASSKSYCVFVVFPFSRLHTIHIYVRALRIANVSSWSKCGEFFLNATQNEFVCVFH